MNRQEAQFILQVYRPGGEDAADPRFREALDLAQRDPELAQWFAQEQALERRLSARLGAALQPPASLQAQLLAQRKVVRLSSPWRHPLWQLAAAACVGLLLTLAAFWARRPRPDDFPRYLAQMTEALGRRLDRLDFTAREVAAVRQWLRERGAHGDVVLPAGLKDRPSLGCKLLEWNGHPVTLICFELESRQVVHLLVVDNHAFPEQPEPTPALRRVGEMATVSWRQDNHVYVLASGAAAPEDLMKLL